MTYWYAVWYTGFLTLLAIALGAAVYLLWETLSSKPVPEKYKRLCIRHALRNGRRLAVINDDCEECNNFGKTQKPGGVTPRFNRKEEE